MSNDQTAFRNDLPPLLVAAEKAAQERNYLRSIEYLETASQQAPHNVNILLGLGAMYGKCYDFIGAEKSFARAIAAATDRRQVLLLAAERCLRMPRDEMAKGYFLRAADLPNPGPLPFVGLAEVYERQGHYSEAAECVERALRIDAACPPGLLLCARLHRKMGDWKAAETILTGLADAGERKISLRVEAGCELARVLDLQQNYDAAMAAAVKAKGLLHPPANVTGYQLKMRSHAQELAHAVSSDKIAKWKEVDDSPCRLAFAGGRPFGTEKTLLENLLATHEEVLYLEDSRIFSDEVFFPARRLFPQGIRSLAFLDALKPDLLTKMRAAYLARTQAFLQKTLGSRLLLEQNHVWNTLLLVMVRVFPEANFLMMVRDPRDAALESFMRFQSINPCGCPFLTLAGSVDENVFTMNYWHKVMAALGDRHLEVRYEQLLADGVSIGRQVGSFLKINLPATPLSSGTTTPSDAWRIGNWKNYQKYLEPHLSVLNPVAELFGY